MKIPAIRRAIGGSFKIGFSMCFAGALLIFMVVAARGQDVEVETAPLSADDFNLGAAALGFSLPVSDRVEILGYGAQVRGRGATSLVGFDARVKINKFLDITPDYLGLFSPKVNGIRNYDHRARLSATLKLKLGDLQITDRNMIERRFRRANSATQYRNGFELLHPGFIIKKDIIRRLRPGRAGIRLSSQTSGVNAHSAWHAQDFRPEIHARFFIRLAV